MANGNGRIKSRARRALRRVRNRIKTISFDSIIRNLTNVTNRPIAILCIILAIVITVSVKASAEANILTSVYTKVAANKIIEPTAKWIKTNTNQTVGILWLTGAITAGAPYNKQIIYLAAIILFTVYMPVAETIEYILESVLLLLFLKYKSPLPKFIIAGAAILLYIAGNLFAHIK